MSSTIGASGHMGQSWIDRGEHLPPLLRAPEAQRALFAALEEDAHFSHHLHANGLSPEIGREFVFGGFLQFMAKFGFTLQKSKLSHGSQAATSEHSAAQPVRLISSSAIMRQMDTKRPKVAAVMSVSDKAIELLRAKSVKEIARF